MAYKNHEIITALLSEQVYQRHDLDMQLTDDDLANLGGVSPISKFSDPDFESALGPEYFVDPEGYIYALGEGNGKDNGFVARVVETGGTVFIVYRGSDDASNEAGNILGGIGSGILYAANNNSQSDSSNFHHNPGETNYADWFWNGAQGVGTVDQNATSFDAIKIAEAVQNAVGESKEIVVTGQSLGGGLAGVVGAVTGLKSHTYAAAFFGSQIQVIAHLRAVEEIIEANGSSIFTQKFNDLDDHTQKIVLFGVFHDAIPGDLQDNFEGVEDVFVPEADASNPYYLFEVLQLEQETRYELIYNQYLVNIEENQTSFRVKDEILSGALVELIINSSPAIPALSSSYIKSTAEDVLFDFGPIDPIVADTSVVSVGLHSPTLHAIGALTKASSSETAKDHHEFAYLYRSDQAFWDSMLVNTGVAGSQDHQRADPLDVSSKVDASGPNVGILQRALMKAIALDGAGNVNTSNENFYNHFFEIFGEKLQKGIASDGLKETSGNPFGSDELSLHAGLVEIGLQILRDGLQDQEKVEDFESNLASILSITEDSKKYYFAGDHENAVIFNTSAINTERTGEYAEKFVDNEIINGSHQAFGISDVEFEIVKKIFRDNNGDKTDPVFKKTLEPWFFDAQKIVSAPNIQGVHDYFAAGSIRLSLDWEILVSQAGEDGAGLTFDASLDHTIARTWSERSHLIFGGDGFNEITATDQSDIIVGRDGGNKLVGGAGDDLLIGGAGKDEFEGEEGNDLLIGGQEDDTFKGSIGNDLIFGGSVASEEQEGVDTVDFSEIDRELVVHFEQEDGSVLRNVQVTGNGVANTLYSIDELILGKKDDTVLIDDLDLAAQDYGLVIDAGEQQVVDTLDFSSLGKGVTLQMQGAGTAIIEGVNITVKNFEDLIGTGLDDVITYATASDENSNELRGTISTGAGDDVIHVVNSTDPGAPQTYEDERSELIIDAGDDNDTVTVEGAAEIYLGKGADKIGAAGVGSTIDAGPGGSTDTDYFNMEGLRGTLGIGLDGYDSVLMYTNWDLAGSYRRHVDSESKYTYGLGGAIKLGINGHSELAVGDHLSKDGDEESFMYLANYVNSLSAASSVLTAGVRMVTVFTGAWQLFKFPGIDALDGDISMWDFIPTAWKDVNFRDEVGGVDPLVLDLDGDGLELTSMVTGVSPMFDMDGDGFAEHTGWVAPDDGMLALDGNGNGVIDDIGELFGGAGQSGFAELALHDDNSDGVIDANDAVYADLKVWRDLDRDGETDDGELFSLTDLNIQSIGLQATDDGSANALNVVERTGSFTYADGTTGEVGDVTFRINNYDTVYTGDTTIAPGVMATMPKLKGHGTLADLQVSVTLDGIDGALAQTINSVLPTLNVVDLDVLYERATAILNAWTNAAPVAPNTGSYSDVPAFISRADGQIDVQDFAYQTTETITLPDDSTVNVTFWKTAGGTPIKDDLGQTIEHPTLEQLLAHQSGVADLTWEMVSAEKLAFMERYFGEEIPINDPTGFSGSSVSGFGAILETTERISEQLTLRLAMQGGLKDYFDGVEYSVEDDRFRPTTDFELIPFFKKVFETSPADAAGAEAWLDSWKPLIDALLSDYERPGGNNINAPFIFTNVVAAYETIGSPVSLAVAAESLGISPDIVDYGSGTRTGTNDQEIFYMSTGDDVVESKAGSDVFVFGENFGQDVINDYESGADDFDTIRFAHLTPEDIVATRDGKDLVLTVTATGDSVRVTGQFHDINYSFFGGQVGPFQGIEEIVFANGDVWGAGEIADAVSHPLDTDDTLIGTDHFDVLDGGLGNDFLQGGNNFDVYRFDAGYGQDIILDRQMNVGSEGRDVVTFGEGLTRADLSFYRDGNSNDLVINTTGGDSLTIHGQFFGSTALGQEFWIDRIESFQFEINDAESLGFSHEDVMRELVAQAKTDGDDTIYGFTFDDVLDGGAGNDTLIGGNKNDTYKFGFGYGSDVFDEGGAIINVGFENTDRVLFGAGVTEADVTLEREGNSNDLIVRLSDGSQFKLLRQFFALNTNGSHIFAIENFEFADGTVWDQTAIYDRMLQGTTGDDSLYGFWRDDVLDGGAGNDYLNGGDGDDTYIFGFGYGEDVVYDELVSIFTNENDKLLFGPGVTQADVTWSRNGDSNNLIATLTDGSQLTINSQFTIDNFGNKHYAIEHFEFEDGSTISLQEIKDQLIQPTVGDDVLYGFASEDVFDGGAGNDVYHGGEYADTYHFGYGYGHDRINDYAPSAFIGGNDRIVFGAGIETSEVSVAWSSEDDIDLVLTVETGETITINNYRSKIFGFSFNTVEEVLFDDGTLWQTPELMARYVEGAVSNGDDSIEGFGELGGEIRAQGGDDTIFGFSGDNIYVGGAGDDHITGGSGDDTYLYEVGDGSDIISERYNGGNDTLKLGAAIDSADVVVKRNLNDIEDVVLELADGSEIVLDDQIRSSGGAGVESIVFNDGTVWTETDLISNYAQANLTDEDDYFVGYATDDTIDSALGDDEVYGGLGNDTITGGVGNDFLVGGRGADTYVFTRGDGADLIEDGGFGGEADKIVLHGYTPEEVVISQIAGTNDLQLSFLGTTDKITLKGNAVSGSVNEIAQIVFDNGQVWESSFVRNLVDGVIDTDGDDVLWGASSDDTLIGGLGNDHLRGGAGADTYVYTRGDGHDRITELQSGVGEIDQLTLIGVAPDDVTVSVSGETVLLTIASSTEGAGDAGSIALDLSLHGANGEGVERISFEDGTFWNSETLRNMLVDQAGSTGDDTLSGMSGANIFSGGQGNDALNGGSGSDVYLYSRGDGDDTITEGRLIQGDDTIRLEGMLPGDIALERVGNDLRIVIQETSAGAGDGGSILVKESLDEDFDEGIERVIFEDGTVWTRADMRSMLLVAASTDGDDSISGFNSSDLIDGGLGNDDLAGGSGSDTYTYSRGDGDDIITEGRLTSGTDRVRLVDVLQGEVSLERVSNNVRIVIAESAEGAADGGSILLKESLDEDFDEGIEQVVFADGTIWTRADLRVELINASQTDQDDTVVGYNTADTIEGGLGDDALYGGSDGDTYLYSRGDGNDTISDGRLTGGTDKLVLVDLLPDDVILGRDGNAARIVIQDTVEGAGDGGSIVLLESLDEDFDEGVEQVEFSDGTIWSRADIRLKLIEASQTEGDDIVSGYGTYDILDGGLGNDLLQGFGGDDTYVYSRGDGHDTIIDGSFSGHNDNVSFADISPSEVMVYRDGDHLLLSIAESSPGVGDGGSIKLIDTARNWFSSGVDKVVFADGTEWSRSDMVNAAVTNAAPNINDDSFSALIPGTPVEINYSDLLENDSDPDGTPLSIVGFRNVIGGQLSIGVNDTVTVTLDDPDVPATFEYLVSDGVYTSVGSVTVSDELVPTIVGTSGNETLNGTNGDDIFEGELGNDRFNSRSGSDVFLYSSGDGNDYIDEESGSTSETDVLRFKDLTADDLTFSRSWSHLVITVTGTGETITLDEQFYNHLYWGIDRVEFADGVVWGRRDLMGAALQPVNGTDGDETISGTSAHESLYGMLGNDTINGGNGDDYHYGGAGDDLLIGNSGWDYFDGGEGNDTLDLSYSSGSFTFDFTAGKIFWNGTGFEEFTNIENLIAGSGSHRIITSADNNVLTGGGGNDTFVFTDTAGGDDTITDFSAGAGSHDVIEFGTDQFADFAAVLAAATDDGAETTIAIDAETSIVLQSILLADLHQDDFQFV